MEGYLGDDIKGGPGWLDGEEFGPAVPALATDSRGKNALPPSGRKFQNVARRVGMDLSDKEIASGVEG